MHSIITFNRDYISMLVAWKGTKRFTTWANDSISRECSPNPPNSTRLSLITIKNALISFSFRRSAAYKGASILPSIGKLGKGVVNFVDYY